VRTSIPVSISQITPRWYEPLTTRFPSAEIATDVTFDQCPARVHSEFLTTFSLFNPFSFLQMQPSLRLWHGDVQISSSVSTSQIFTVMSSDPLTMRFPSTEIATECTRPECPASVHLTSPVPAWQIFTVLSFEALTTHLPQCENATEFILLSCSPIVSRHGSICCGRRGHSTRRGNPALLAATQTCETSGSCAASWKGRAASLPHQAWSRARCLPTKFLKCSRRCCSGDGEPPQISIASAYSRIRSPPCPTANLAATYASEHRDSAARRTSPARVAWYTSSVSLRVLGSRLSPPSSKRPSSASGCAGTMRSPVVSPGKKLGRCTCCASHELYGFGTPAHAPAKRSATCWCLAWTETKPSRCCPLFPNRYASATSQNCRWY